MARWAGAGGGWLVVGRGSSGQSLTQERPGGPASLTRLTNTIPLPPFTFFLQLFEYVLDYLRSLRFHDAASALPKDERTLALLARWALLSHRARRACAALPAHRAAACCTAACFSLPARPGAS